MITVRVFLITTLIFAATLAYGQRGRYHHHHRHGHGRHHHVVVKRSHYRPAKVVVYHPHWRPYHAYHRRWVFFPRYNLYWDNWRNHFLFWNGAIWVSRAAPPQGISEKELEKAEHRELKVEEDGSDDVYRSNETHKKEDKPEGQ